MTNIEERRTVNLDGLITDVDTGEILEAQPPDYLLTDNQLRVTRDYAEWILDKIASREAQLLSAQSRLGDVAKRMEEVLEEYRRQAETDPRWIRLEAQTRNLEAMSKEALRDWEWLTARFRAELEQFVKNETAGKKARSVKTAFGTVGIRRKPGSVKILDQEKAVELARFLGLESAITESVSVSAIKPAVLALDVQDPNVSGLVSGAVEIAQPHDELEVKTRVEGR